MAYSVDKYDLDEVFNNGYTDTNEEILALLNDKRIIKYRCKTIKSGNVLECEVYPIWNTRASLGRAKKIKESREVQKRLNQKNAVKQAIRLVNTNFTDDDIWATFTYENMPVSVEAAQKEMAKYLRRVRYYCQKHDLPPLKYIYTTERGKKSKRIHHHIVMNFRDRDLAEKFWTHGSRPQTRRLSADEDGYEGLTRYITKHPESAKCYVASKNLQKPQITIADCKFTRRKVNKLANGKVDAQAVFAAMYGKQYQLAHFVAKTSDFVTGAYIYARLAKQNFGGTRKNEVYRQ